jgi:hypothetical protein
MIALPEVEREDHDKRQHNMQQKKEYDKGSGIHTSSLSCTKRILVQDAQKCSPAIVAQPALP